MKKYAIMKVADPFRRRLKVIAAEKGCSVFKLTEEMSRDDYNTMINEKIKPKKQNNGWDFRI